jgi:hypothetical protein
VTIQEPTQVTSCNLLAASVCRLSFNIRSARMSFSQVQRGLIVGKYLAFHSYLTCQNASGDNFPILLCQVSGHFLVWWTVLMTQGANRTNCSGRNSVLSDDSLDETLSRSGHYQQLIKQSILFYEFNRINFLTNRRFARSSFLDFSINLCMCGGKVILLFTYNAVSCKYIKRGDKTTPSLNFGIKWRWVIILYSHMRSY